MKHSNYSDLLIQVPFVDEEGESATIPAYDFELEYFTHPDYKKVMASQHNGVLTNCKVVDGTLTCYFDSPMLGRGKLLSRKIYHIPDSNFPDGVNTLVVMSELDVDIV